jgi:hypothetical protein
MVHWVIKYNSLLHPPNGLKHLKEGGNIYYFCTEKNNAEREVVSICCPHCKIEKLLNW